MNTLENLITDVKQELKALHYPPGYFKRHDCIWKRFYDYAKQRHQEYFTEELG